MRHEVPTNHDHCRRVTNTAGQSRMQFGRITCSSDPVLLVMTLSTFFSEGGGAKLLATVNGAARELSLGKVREILTPFFLQSKIFQRECAQIRFLTNVSISDANSQRGTELNFPNLITILIDDLFCQNSYWPWILDERLLVSSAVKILLANSAGKASLACRGQYFTPISRLGGVSQATICPNRLSYLCAPCA